MKTPLAAALALAALGAACGSPAHEPAAPEPGAPVDAATVAAAVTTVPSRFESGGVIRARVTAPIASRVMAPIVEVPVRAGDRVRRGAPLVVLDAREVQAHKDRAAAAEVAAQQSALAAEADVAAAEAGLRLARATHQRVADLAARKSATPQELDQALAALQAAEAQLRAAGSRRAAASAAHEAARAAAVAADTGVSYTVLNAPFDAVVAERSADPGMMAVPGTPLLTLEDPASFRLEVRIDESKAAQVSVGQGVEYAVGNPAAGTPAWTAGTVSEIARLDPASHAFLVKIDLPPGTDARSGGFGRARFAGPTREALTVPSATLVRRGQLVFVFTVDASQRAHLRAVSPGDTSGDRVEILAGLGAGDLVVVNPPPSLADGRLVQRASTVARGEAR